MLTERPLPKKKAACQRRKSVDADSSVSAVVQKFRGNETAGDPKKDFQQPVRCRVEVPPLYEVQVRSPHQPDDHAAQRHDRRFQNLLTHLEAEQIPA